MAVALEFIDFLIPVQIVKDKYPGGWDAFLKDYQYDLGRRVWFDEHLVRDGAMSPHDIGMLVEDWTAMGFEPFGERDGEKFWKDCCVFEGLFGGGTLPCDWIDYDPKRNCAFLKGTNPGETVGRDSSRGYRTEPLSDDE